MCESRLQTHIVSISWLSAGDRECSSATDGEGWGVAYRPVTPALITCLGEEGEGGGDSPWEMPDDCVRWQNRPALRMFLQP